MKKLRDKFTILLFSACFALLISACGVQSAATDAASESLPPAAPLASDERSNDGAIRFLENKLKNDPDDFSASNKLAGLYLQKLRETGNVQYLKFSFPRRPRLALFCAGSAKCGRTRRARAR